MVLKILFLTFSNLDILFPKKKLTQRSYTSAKPLLTTYQIEFISKKKFVRAAIDENVKIFVIYPTFISLSSILIYLTRVAYISLLIVEKVDISKEYFDFPNVFLEEMALILLKIINLNQFAIELQNSQQLLFGLIYSLGILKLQILKTYIKTKLAYCFI